MADETGVTVLLTDGSEEHFEQAVRWTSREDGGLLLIFHEANGENQEIVAEYLPGRAVRVCHGPPFRLPPEGEGNAGPDDEKAAIYEAGFKAGQDALAQAVEAQAQGPDRAETPERPWEKVGGAPSGNAIAPEPEGYSTSAEDSVPAESEAAPSEV